MTFSECPFRARTPAPGLRVAEEDEPLLSRWTGARRLVVTGLWLVLALPAVNAALLEREPNTTLRMPAALSGKEADLPYRVVEAFEGLSLDQPVAVASPPGDTNRLFIVERTGRILVVTNLASPTATIFLDIRQKVASDWDNGKVEGLSSMAFHPGYLHSRFPAFFVTYTLRAGGPEDGTNYNRLSRFQSTRARPDYAAAETEVPLINQSDEGDGHNFNDLAFGPDGYLYVALGDEGDGGKGDDFDNAQRIDKDFFSGILRIDVDNRPDNFSPNPHPAILCSYAIPADNPWVGQIQFNGLPVDPSGIRTEFYAVGLRNPWRITFDPWTGNLYAADVGQHGREEINQIVKGGNYGWSFREGSLPGPKGSPPPDWEAMGPIYEYGPGYGPDQGFSVTGGVVYRGTLLPELSGEYVFADYVIGNIWALRFDSAAGSSVRRIAAHRGIAGFGVDPRNGELLLLDHDRGRILRLEPAKPAVDTVLPQTLSSTGVFADLVHLVPNAGIWPYQVNLPFWSDGAEKRRWFSVPDPDRTLGFSDEQNWSFPEGTVWIKHFELTNAVPEPLRRLETRLLVKSTGGVYGVTYRWGETNAEAQLVPAEGLDEAILINDGGVLRTQIWHYPSRSECLTCHTPAAGYALGFNTAQLNRSVQVGPLETNQIYALSAAGFFQTTVSNVHARPALASLLDENVSREFRVRSYLAVNCGPCHQPGGGAHAQFDTRLTTSLRDSGIVGGRLFEQGGHPENRVIKPGSVEQSMLLTRMSEPGPRHMPPIGSTVVDHEAIRLIRDWVLQDLPESQTYPDWQRSFFGSTAAEEAAGAADPDGDGASNYLEYLTDRDPLRAEEVWRIGVHRDQLGVQILFPRIANRIFQVQWSDSFSAPISWHPLDVWENRPMPAISNQAGIVRDPGTNSTTRFYRVTVREP